MSLRRCLMSLAGVTLVALQSSMVLAKEKAGAELTIDDDFDSAGNLKSAKKKKTALQTAIDDGLEVTELSNELSVIEDKIRVTKKQIGKIRDASYLPDLYFALADMYVQKAKIQYLIKVARNPGKNLDTLDFSAEKRPKLDAIDIYQKIYSFFPKEKRRDKALFLQALEQRDLGQMEQMLRTINQLSEEFPRSEHYNEANIVLADYFFEVKKDIEMTLEILKRVTSREVTAFTPLAHYRVGWCHMNLGQPDEAVKAFEKALETQNLVNSDSLPEIYRRTDIRREAVLALAVPYVDVFSHPEKKYGEFAPPVDYFKSKASDHFTYRRVLSRAGRRLIIKERWQEAADCFFHVLVLSSDFDQRLEASQRVNDAHKRQAARIDLLPFIRETAVTVDILQASQERPLILNAAALMSLEKSSKSASGKKPKSPKEARAESSDDKKAESRLRALNHLKFLELLMRDFATQLHKRARASGSPEDFAQAAEAYELYLDRFAKAPKALDMHYNLGEALFKGDRLVKAGMQYELLSREKRLQKRSSMFQESAIESYTKALQNADTLQPLERIRARQGLRSVGGAWIQANPRAPGASTAAFNIANSWYEERNLKKAIELFKAFIAKYPKDPRVRDAIFLTMNSYSQLDDFKALEATGDLLGRTPGLSDEDRQAIRDAVRRAQSKQLQKTAGDFGTKEYAENLLSVASKYKGSSLGVQALYEAFNSLKSKRDPELFEVGEAMLDQHSDSQYAKEIASSMANLALNTASFDRAAKYLALFADKYPQEKEAGDFRRTSAALFERQGDFKKARTQYVKLDDKAAVARMDLATNDWVRLEQSSVESGLREGTYWKTLAVWRQKRYQDAQPLLTELAGNPNAPADQSGHAKFLLAQLSLERFRAIQMKSADDQQALMDKVKAFQMLAAELETLIKSAAGRWPIAGLYLLGQTHYDLGRFIADSPLPPGLSEADKKAYIDELNKQASAYIAESEKVFAKCIEAAQVNDVFTRYVDGCRGKGQKVVREEDDMTKVQAKAAGAEPRRAREIRQKLIENPRSIELLFELGESYIKADQPQTASGIFSRILELESVNARAEASIGVAHLYLNDFDSAYMYLKRALEHDANDATALWNLAGLYRQFGFKDKAAKYRAQTTTLKRPKLVHPWANGI